MDATWILAPRNLDARLGARDPAQARRLAVESERKHHLVMRRLDPAERAIDMHGRMIRAIGEDPSFSAPGLTRNA